MNRRSKLVSILIVSWLASCSKTGEREIDYVPPYPEIVSWSVPEQTLTLKAVGGDIDISNFTLHKEGTKTIRSFYGITLREGVATPIYLTGKFFSKSGNVFYLNEQIMVDKGEDFK